jgi:hypothetical protein
MAAGRFTAVAYAPSMAAGRAAATRLQAADSAVVVMLVDSVVAATAVGSAVAAMPVASAAEATWVAAVVVDTGNF